jgi:hypothetical protein
MQKKKYTLGQEEMKNNFGSAKFNLSDYIRRQASLLGPVRAGCPGHSRRR